MPRRFTDSDERFMRRALALAARGEGRVEPNPMVGCVVVRGGRVVAEGYHRRFGGPHAEIAALRRAGDAARGATAYVTLEPCAHSGKTPPCADALIDAGVHCVIAAVTDPCCMVNGRGFRRLRNAGVEVRCGLLADDARRLMAPYLHRIDTGRPWVIAKWAQSLDGKIATHTAQSQWITSPASRTRVHRLRGRVDAILTGVNTVLADDCELTARQIRPRRVARRVVLDADLRTPTTARVVQTAREVPTTVFTTRRAAGRTAGRYERLGVEIVAVPGPGGRLDLPTVLRELGSRGVTNVLVEAGGTLLGSFFDQQLINEAVVFVAPILIGGLGAPGPLGGQGISTLEQAPRPQLVETRRCGPDTMYRLRVPVT